MKQWKKAERLARKHASSNASKTSGKRLSSHQGIGSFSEPARSAGDLLQGICLSRTNADGVAVSSGNCDGTVPFRRIKPPGRV